MSIEKYIKEFEKQFFTEYLNKPSVWNKPEEMLAFLRTSLEEYGRERFSDFRDILFDKLEELSAYSKKNRKDYETTNEANFAYAQVKDILNNLK